MNEDWHLAMEDEIEKIHKNDSWDLIPPPKNNNIIQIKWIYKIKHHIDGNIAKHKYLLVEKDYVQNKVLEYENTFDQITKLETIKSILTLTYHFGMIMY